MRAPFRPLRPFVTPLKVIALLVVVDLWVRGPFFARYVAPLSVNPFDILRDRTFGQNVLPLLEDMRRGPRGVRITFLGDSVLRSVEQPDESTVPYLVQRQLRERFPSRQLRVVDCSEIGLYAGDAMLLASKLIAAGSDVIVYEVLPRALPRPRHPEWDIRVSGQLSPHDLWRVLRVGGGPWLAHNLDSAKIASGAITTSWALYAYRSNLKLFVRDVVLPPFFPYSGLLAPLFDASHWDMPPPSGPPELPQGYEWSLVDYGPPSPNWDAVDLFGRLCEQYLPGRCVLYSGPINPVGRTQTAEPGLIDAYLAHVRTVAGRHALVWRDYTDAMTGADFNPSRFGRVVDSIHLNSGGNAKLAQLLAAPVAEVVQRVAENPELGRR